MVSNRLENIDKSAIPNDEVLKQAAGMLTLCNEYDYVQVGKSQVFLVCSGCHGHRVYTNQKNLSAMYRACQKKENISDWNQNRRIKNHDLRVSPVQKPMVKPPKPKSIDPADESSQ